MQIESEIKEVLTELFKLIGIEVKLDVSKDGDIYKINIDPGESAGLLIGAHGMTLYALQSFLAMALKQKTGDWVNVNIDINHWNEKQEGRLIDLAKSASERAKQTGEEQRLYNLNTAQRRVIHMYLSKDESVATESLGEGIDRYLVVRAK